MIFPKSESGAGQEKAYQQSRLFGEKSFQYFGRTPRGNRPSAGFDRGRSF